MHLLTSLVWYAFMCAVLCFDPKTLICLDSPARQKMACWPPAAAYLACGWCLFEGIKREGDRATNLLAMQLQQSRPYLLAKIQLCKFSNA